MSKRCDACGCIHTGDYSWATNWRHATDARWIPAPDAQQRYTPFGEQQPNVFLGNWGAYDVWTYKSGITLVADNGLRTGYFPLMGIAPIEQGRVWIDGALEVCHILGLFADKLAAGPYGPTYKE